MTDEQLEHFRNLLLRQLKQLLDRADLTVIDLLDLDASAADPLDRATLESDREYTLRIRDRESRLIKKIRQSLEDIDNATYGICQRCGEDISLARLEARPVARHCIDCKNKMEALERAAGF
jgi:DnaK suppressor protein